MKAMNIFLNDEFAIQICPVFYPHGVSRLGAPSTTRSSPTGDAQAFPSVSQGTMERVGKCKGGDTFQEGALANHQ